MLAALREIYDGAWTRHVGSDGGRTLTWTGKVGLIFAATQAYDEHHSVISNLGDRFLIARLTPSPDQTTKILALADDAGQRMREELAGLVAGLIANLPKQDPPTLDDSERQRLAEVVKVAVRLRGHVDRDRYSREVEAVHDAEGAGRMLGGLKRLFGGAVRIGLDRATAMKMIETVALDSCPPIRRRALRFLAATPQATRDIAVKLDLPTTTTRRALEDLAAYRLSTRDEQKHAGADQWRINPTFARWGRPD
jgi:hypothetical protein